MMRTYPGDDSSLRAAGTRAATTALRSGRLVIAPADSHYAVVADAFSQSGVAKLRQVRGIPEHSAVPVFINKRATMHALWGRVPREAEVLARAFWPGPLTLIGKPQLSLAWSAGVPGSVALRMPLHPWMLELVAEVGPIASTGAQVAGAPLPVDIASCDSASAAIGLDAGTLPGGPGSTVVDLRSGVDIIRVGAISSDDISKHLGPTAD